MASRKPTNTNGRLGTDVRPKLRQLISLKNERSPARRRLSRLHSTRPNRQNAWILQVGDTAFNSCSISKLHVGNRDVVVIKRRLLICQADNLRGRFLVVYAVDVMHRCVEGLRTS